MAFDPVQAERWLDDTFGCRKVPYRETCAELIGSTLGLFEESFKEVLAASDATAGAAAWANLANVADDAAHLASRVAARAREQWKAAEAA